MSTIQPASLLGVSRSSAIQKTATPQSLPFIAINSSTAQNLSFTTVSKPSALRTSDQQEANVKHVISCLSDYYIQNNNETTTHRLVNICQNTTTVSGYVDPKCNVNQPQNNQINAYKLVRQGDMYIAETKNSENCQQPIFTRLAPEKLRECLYVSTAKNDNLNSFNHTVINACDRQVKGYLEKKCYKNEKVSGLSGWFTLKKQGDTRLFVTQAVIKGRCKSPISEADRLHSLSRSYGCVSHYVKKNDDDTITITLGNGCRHTINRYIKQGCNVASSPPYNKLNHFSLAVGDNYTALFHDKPECNQPFRYVERPIPNHSEFFCRSKAPSAPNATRPEKIVAGEGLQSQEARYLVVVNDNDDNSVSTGALISDRHVLTAAHGVTKKSNRLGSALEQITVGHDPHPSRKLQRIPTTKYKVTAGSIHPDYFENPSNYNGDVAILELEKPVVNGQIMPLPTDEEFCEFAEAVDNAMKTDEGYPAKLTGTYNKTDSVWLSGNAVIQGFGGQKDSLGNLVSSRVARHGKIVVTSMTDYEGTIVSLPNVHGTDICFGDSGGPLLFETSKGKKVQVGVNTRIDAQGHCCSNEKYTSCSAKSYFANMGNSKMRAWIEERLAEDSKSITLNPKDHARLRFSPDTCVEKSDAADGFFSWLASFSSAHYRRRITLTNNCHDKNHLATVNVKFYSEENKDKQESVAGIEKIENTIQLEVGETRVFHTDGTTDVKTALSWSDLDK